MPKMYIHAYTFLHLIIVMSYPIDPEFCRPNVRKMLWEDLCEPWQSKLTNLVCYTFSCIKYIC